MSININHLGGDNLAESIEMVANHIKSGYNFKHEEDGLRLVEPSTTEKIAKWIPFINYGSMIPENEVIDDLRIVLLRANEEGLSEAKKEKLDIIRRFYDRVIGAKETNKSYEAGKAPIESLQKDVLVNMVAPDFGPEQWAEMGVKVDSVPPIPKIILNREDPSSYFVVLIPGGICFNELVAKSGVPYDFKWDTLDEYGNKPEQMSYWVAIKKELMPGSHGIDTRREQLWIAKADGIHQAPSLMEAIACNLASYKITGKSLWGEKCEGLMLWYSVCREEEICGVVLSEYKRLIVGGSASGLIIDINYGSNDVGVARLLREFLAPCYFDQLKESLQFFV